MHNPIFMIFLQSPLDEGRIDFADNIFLYFLTCNWGQLQAKKPSLQNHKCLLEDNHTSLGFGG